MPLCYGWDQNGIESCSRALDFALDFLGAADCVCAWVKNGGAMPSGFFYKPTLFIHQVV